MHIQTNLFIPTRELLKLPLVVAYGMGVNSTAMLIGMYKRGLRPDAILFADTGNEKKTTYAYFSVISAWLEKVGFPPIQVVRNVPKRFNANIPFYSLGEQCLSYGVLPSLAYGFKSCSLKWKVRPQDKWIENWPTARNRWAAGGKVIKAIGYDADPKDMKRYAHVKGLDDPKYTYFYPLIDWGMTRKDCEDLIRSAGLPLPPKSACYFCPATKAEELKTMDQDHLRYNVVIESIAAPNLQGLMSQQELDLKFKKRHLHWQQKLRCADHSNREKLQKKEPKPYKCGSGCSGLWRTATKNRPASMTKYIQDNGLLPELEIQKLQHQARTVRNNAQEKQTYSEWRQFIAQL